MEAMMTEYPPLPFPPNAELGEALYHYGIRLLMFVVDTEVTATLSDLELELAHYVVPIAQANRGKDGTDLMVVEHIRSAAHLIQATLHLRRMLEEEAAAALVVAPNVEDGGQLAPNVYAQQRNPQPPVEKVDWNEVRKLFEKDKSYQSYIDKLRGMYPDEGWIPMADDTPKMVKVGWRRDPRKADDIDF